MVLFSKTPKCILYFWNNFLWKISPRCNFFLLTVSLLDVSEKKIYLKQKKWLKIFDGGLRPLLQPQQMGGKILKNPSLSLARSSDRSHGGGLISHLLKKKFNVFRFWPQASSAGGWCQKSPLDGSNQRSEGTLQQSVSCDLQFLIRKTTDVYKHV